MSSGLAEYVATVLSGRSIFAHGSLELESPELNTMLDPRNKRVPEDVIRLE